MFHYDAQELIEPITKSDNEANEKLSDDCEAATAAIEVLDERFLENGATNALTKTSISLKTFSKPCKIMKYSQVKLVI